MATRAANVCRAVSRSSIGQLSRFAGRALVSGAAKSVPSDVAEPWRVVRQRALEHWGGLRKAHGQRGASPYRHFPGTYGTLLQGEARDGHFPVMPETIRKVRR